MKSPKLRSQSTKKKHPIRQCLFRVGGLLWAGFVALVLLAIIFWCLSQILGLVLLALFMWSPC